MATDASWREPVSVGQPLRRGLERSSRYLTMRDGVRLAIDLYLPSDLRGGERLPTMLRQTRYFRSDDFRWPFRLFLGQPLPLTRAFVEHGYAWVDVDVRGSGASFGSRPSPWGPQEVRDGAEVVNWIVSQDWSDGSVGTLGVSYDGTAAEMLLTNQHPAVKAAAPRFSLFDVYADIAFPGGLHLSWFTETWGRFNAALDRNRLTDVLPGWVSLFVRGVRPVDEDFDRELLRQAVLAHADNYDVHAGALRMVYRDDPLIEGRPETMDSFSPHAQTGAIEAAQVPIYSYSGWFDGAYANAAIKRHLAIRTPGSRLLLGPWNHGGTQNISTHSPAREARFDHEAELLRFFDTHLKRQPAMKTDPPVAYFTMGEERWKLAHSWPPASKVQKFYFNEAGSLSRVPLKGAGTTDTYAVDPSTGTGSHSRWNSLMGLPDPIGYPDQARADLRRLHYTSLPLATDLEVTGHATLQLHVSVNASDAAFFVYLEDVDPQGGVTYVTEGMLRARHRQGSPRSFRRADASPLTSGEPAVVRFDLLPVSYLFRRGHSIRVALAGADADHFAALPGDPPIWTVYRDAGRASRIELPVVAPGSGLQ